MPSATPARSTNGSRATARRVALVTGSSRGLGRATALAFARAGWGVVVNAVRSGDGAADTAREVRRLGGGAVVAMGDVAAPAARAGLINAALERWGRLDCLVNNAAIARDRPLARFPDADWDRTVETNLLAPMALARRAADAMARGGSIVNIVSLCGLWGCAGSVAYSAAKGALAGFTAAAARAFADRGVRVNAVAPGYLATDLGRSVPQMMAAARAAHPMHTLGDPAAAAGFIVRLAAMSSISGQVFSLDGRIR
jgi:3-oxoacyl-[acyl-carrier protein] reductase